MLRSVVEYAKLSASSVVSRIVGGAIVVAPFIIAASFGLAALYMWLRNNYGDVTAAIMLAVGFAVIGVIAAIVVAGWIKNQQRRLDETKAEAQQSAFSTALLAANPALMLGAARIGLSLFRRAPVLTAVAPLAAGFILAMASARERRRANAGVPPNGSARRDARPMNTRQIAR